MQDEPRGGHVYQHSSRVPSVNEADVNDMSAGFPKSKRLLSPKQFSDVLRNGKKIFNPVFLLIILPSSANTSRVGIVVSKKVSKRAVDRNRIKRQVREFFRLNQKLWSNYEVVVIANAPAADSDNTIIQKALKNAWCKAGRQIKDKSCS